MSITYAVSNQKGGCGKTTLCLNLGASLARSGHKVLIVDADPQANATMALGCPQPDELPVTLPPVMNEIIRTKGKTDSELLARREYILRAQGIDFVPSSIELAETENILVNAISRENVLKKFIAYIKEGYDYVLLDCMPSL
ncbi:MAG: AAA family ATPase, partial [Clostridiales Family XIII bacterium]|nr:AAA family ATPase [Clostridiales Family XIII bacterium]